MNRACLKLALTANYLVVVVELVVLEAAGAVDVVELTLLDLW